jgi:hypothetical protein
MAEQNIYET